jgi:Fur family ferric uptake transcriptional regulator
MKTQQARILLEPTGLKITTERLLVLQTLINLSEPASVEKVSSLLKKDVNESTVYRILDRLTQHGLLYQSNFRDSKAYYEYQEKHHHHITCTSCGQQEHISVCLPPSTEKAILKKSKIFCQPLHHTLEFFGICKKCESC